MKVQPSISTSNYDLNKMATKKGKKAKFQGNAELEQGAFNCTAHLYRLLGRLDSDRSC
jgi:hypothetical protein